MPSGGRCGASSRGPGACTDPGAQYAVETIPMNSRKFSNSFSPGHPRPEPGAGRGTPPACPPLRSPSAPCAPRSPRDLQSSHTDDLRVAVSVSRLPCQRDHGLLLGYGVARFGWGFLGGGFGVGGGCPLCARCVGCCRWSARFSGRGGCRAVVGEVLGYAVAGFGCAVFGAGQSVGVGEFVAGVCAGQAHAALEPAGGGVWRCVGGDGRVCGGCRAGCAGVGRAPAAVVEVVRGPAGGFGRAVVVLPAPSPRRFSGAARVPWRGSAAL